MNWIPYNPSWLIELARLQYPQVAWLPEALARCTHYLDQGDGYFAFVERERATSPESEWGFKSNLILKHQNGDIVLDILRNNHIGGMEQFADHESQGNH